MVELCHGLAYQALNGAFARKVCMMGGFVGWILFFIFSESSTLTGNHSGGVCVCDSIHHNIVCPRASFSHTQIVEIALTVAYTATQTWLYAIYTNTHSFHTKYSSASVSLRHTHGHASAFTCCFCTPPRHTPFRHSPLSSHTNLAFRYSLSRSSSRQADRLQCCVVVVLF